MIFIVLLSAFFSQIGQAMFVETEEIELSTCNTPRASGELQSPPSSMNPKPLGTKSDEPIEAIAEVNAPALPQDLKSAYQTMLLTRLPASHVGYIDINDLDQIKAQTKNVLTYKLTTNELLSEKAQLEFLLNDYALSTVPELSLIHISEPTRPY